MFVRNLSFLCGLGEVAKYFQKYPCTYSSFVIPEAGANIITEKCYSDICGTCYYYNFVKKNSEGTTWIMKGIRVDANINMSFYTSAYICDKINKTMNWFRHLNLCERFAFKVPEKPKPYWTLQQKPVWLLTNIYGYWRHRVLEYQPNMPPVRFHWEQ